MKLASLRPLLPRSAIRRRQLLPSRHYAMQASGAPMLQVFNDTTKQLQRERAAADADGSREVDYVRDKVASILCERLLVRSCFLYPKLPCGVPLTAIARTSSAIFPGSSTSVPMPAMWAVLSLCLSRALHLSPPGSHISRLQTLHRHCSTGTLPSRSTRSSHLTHVQYLAHQISHFLSSLSRSMPYFLPSPSIGLMIFPACSPKSAAS